MEAGLKPKVNNISIKKIGKEYEINFGEEIWIYIGSKKDLTELRDKINSTLIEEDKNFEMLREKQDYIDEVKKETEKFDANTK